MTLPHIRKFILRLTNTSLIKLINIIFNKINNFDNSCDAYMPHDMWYSKKFKILMHHCVRKWKDLTNALVSQEKEPNQWCLCYTKSIITIVVDEDATKTIST